MRINLGCNKWKLPSPWINIDICPAVNPDMVANVLSLPFEDCSVGEIYLGHTVEHLTLKEFELGMVEWKRVLVPGGKLTVTVPDIAKGLSLVHEGRMTRELLVQCVFGGAENRKEQDHRNVFDGKMLANDLGRHFEFPVEIIPESLAPFLVPHQTAIQCFKAL